MHIGQPPCVEELQEQALTACASEVELYAGRAWATSVSYVVDADRLNADIP